ncbi:MAG: PRC-barrel domain-containing protein [Patescibacteria group bacterium]|nr:PRC-barrel domain-containing protein [Patescibacteria group bacterium]
MLKSIKLIVGSKVMDFAEDTALGEVVDWVLDPENRKISAFLVRGSGWFAKLQALPSMDVVEYGPKIIVAKKASDLETPGEIMKHPRNLKQKGRLLGSPAFTQDGHKLGIVDDVLFETSDASIQKVYISKSGVSVLSHSDLIITIDRVLEILPNKIVVKDTTTSTEPVRGTAGAKA